MEISIDVSKHVVDEIQNIAHSENKDFDVIASKILELGLRIYQSTKNEDKDEKDPLLISVFRRTTESNLLIKEMLGHVFDKNRSSLKVYDHSSAIHAIEKTTNFFLKENDLI